MMTYCMIKIYMFVLFLHSLECKSITEEPDRNYEIDAVLLRIAMKGLGADRASIIDVVGTTTNADRQHIRKAYAKQYPTDLISDLERKLYGEFEITIVGLMLTKDEFYAKELYDALFNYKVDKLAIAEILASMNRTEVKAISKAYEYDYGATLSDDIRNKTSDPFRYLLLKLCNTSREDHGFDVENAKRDSNTLIYACEKSKKLENIELVEETLVTILSTRSGPQLKKIFEEFTKIKNEGIVTTVKRWYLIKSMEFTLLSLIRCAYSRIEYYAELLHDALEEFVPNDRQIIRIIVGRTDIDLYQIQNAYEYKYKSSLAQQIRMKIFGDHKDILLGFLHGRKYN